MKTAVWDTYVKKKDGTVLHFDILVPENLNDSEIIFQYGEEYLKSIGENSSEITSEQCQLCHVEVPGEEVIRAISEKGYYILEMDEIPASLPDNPSRRDKILYLRAHFPEYRFANFRGVPDDEIENLLYTIIKGTN